MRRSLCAPGKMWQEVTTTSPSMAGVDVERFVERASQPGRSHALGVGDDRPSAACTNARKLPRAADSGSDTLPG